MLQVRPSKLLKHSLRPVHQPVRLSGRRYQSQDSHNSQSPGTPFIQDQIASAASTAFGFYARFFQYSFLGIFGLGLTAWSLYEGAHIWVESLDLAPERDDEIRKWEWDRDAEKWTGGERGGTDPALGYRGRHLLRASYMAETWGVGPTTFVDVGAQGTGSLGVIEARLSSAHKYMEETIKIAEERMPSSKLRPQTINELLARHATVLERIGTKEAFFEARSKYERVWAGLSATGPEAARTASKLGDLNFRLGESKDALAWWTRALGLSQGTQQFFEASAIPTISQTVPSSPSAQRTLASTLVSLSAYYSTSGQLKHARQIQESALALLRSIPSPPSISSVSPPQALHSLYLLHRSSLVSIHLAEVHHAVQSSRRSSMDYLKRAAESSERVALALTGLPFSSPDSKGSSIAHTPAPDAPILPVYAASFTMRRPAASLLRHARRTAAEAWNLMGILSEQEGRSEQALECYERAVGWAGVASDQSAPGEGTSEADWKIMWANYSRARDAVGKPEKS